MNKDARINDNEIIKSSKTLNINDLAYSLQSTLAKILTFKIEKVLDCKQVNTIILGGGVAANQYLTDYLQKYLQSKKINLFVPKKKYCTDNAAMIGILTFYKTKLSKI